MCCASLFLAPSHLCSWDSVTLGLEHQQKLFPASKESVDVDRCDARVTSCDFFPFLHFRASSSMRSPSFLSPSLGACSFFPRLCGPLLLSLCHLWFLFPSVLIYAPRPLLGLMGRQCAHRSKPPPSAPPPEAEGGARLLVLPPGHEAQENDDPDTCSICCPSLPLLSLLNSA